MKLKAKQRGPCIRRKLLAEKEITLPLRSEAVIGFLSPQLPDDCEFLFEPTTSRPNITLFAHLLDYSTTEVLVRNNYNKSVQIPCSFRLGAATEVFYKNCFQAELDQSHAAYLPTFAEGFRSQQVKVSAVEPSLETRLPNGIMVYGPHKVISLFQSLVDKFPSIWEP